jgi:galactokinase
VRPASARASAGGWRHYVEVTGRRLARNFPGAALGADIVFASDLPRAAGMSSSSALIVSIAVALVRRAGLDGREEWRRNIRGPLGAAGYYACIENGMSFGALDGDAGVGTHGGSEDHAAMLTAAAGRVSALAFAPLRALDTVPLPDAWTFVVAPSGVAAEKTGAVRESYNRLSAGVRRLLEIWRAAEGNADSLADALATRADAVDRLRALVAQAASSDPTAAALERRLDHFLREDARIPAACQAIRAADPRAMGEIADASQREAETLLGNQVPQTIALAARARADGAFAASSFGAGFGGSVWALVERDEAPAFAARWHESAFVALPGPSLQEL